ncbi:nucleoredoxin-like protein 1 [Lates japonicus]|uniref:Nucleoredoxin-like protein 1 n=1 Tax=Lates japonicus TaxID=270547 RepID=A0AAD3MUT7_LATJO|nr:nucleoredoxin-like protein 1 [Lates japonicus]
MVDLFLNRVLVENNWDQDELNTEREIVGILENRIVLLFFASSECEKCQEFVPVLNQFFKRLKDPAYIEYPKLLALIYISLDQSEEQQERFLKELHKKVLFLAFEDPYRKELQAMFKVKDVPTVVVLRPDRSILSPNAVQDICRFGSDCFRNWQESAALVERSFMLNEEFDDLNLRTATDPVRRLNFLSLSPITVTLMFVDPVLVKSNKEQEEAGHRAELEATMFAMEELPGWWEAAPDAHPDPLAVEEILRLGRFTTPTGRKQ